ncbi:predicted ATPase [Hydrogenimonas sp.]|nr:predicted ATPase [Hydrogenimonas sp.]
MKEIFKKLIVDSQERVFGTIVPRDYDIPLDTKKIVSLIGVRRSGKTYILYSIIQKLRESIDPKNSLYVNFEDDRLFPLKVQDLDALMEGYYELYPDKRDEKVYLFLDEVQNVEGWERYIRRIHDTLNVRIYITGSSSKLLSSEIATSLRGRTVSYEIFPFSFKEYLRYRGIEVNFYSSKNLSYIKHAFGQYLTDGGFAETFEEDEDVKRRILKDYLDLIVYKDVVERYGIKNQSLLKHLIKYLIVNMGTLVSFNKLYNIYKSQGYKVGKDTIYDYLSHLQDAYTFFAVTIFRNSVKEERRHPKKIYVVDNGFKKLFNITLSDDYSKLYENMAFLHLRRQTSEIYYFKGDREVDFYTDIDTKTLVNVSYDLNDEATLQRELSRLNEAMAYFDVSKSYLITSEREESIETDRGIVEVLPMWKWLLK